MNGDKPFLLMDEAAYKALKRAYAKAVADGVDTFQFQGHLVLVAYAELLIEYLAPRFEPNKRRH